MTPTPSFTVPAELPSAGEPAARGPARGAVS